MATATHEADTLVHLEAGVREHPVPSDGEEFVREDEFQCSRCGLIVPRARMGDAWLRLCFDCAQLVATGALT
jgi:hypothetical protein